MSKITGAGSRAFIVNPDGTQMELLLTSWTLEFGSSPLDELSVWGSTSSSFRSYNQASFTALISPWQIHSSQSVTPEERQVALAILNGDREAAREAAYQLILNLPAAGDGE